MNSSSGGGRALPALRRELFAVGRRGEHFRRTFVRGGWNAGDKLTGKMCTCGVVFGPGAEYQVLSHVAIPGRGEEVRDPRAHARSTHAPFLYRFAVPRVLMIASERKCEDAGANGRMSHIRGPRARMHTRVLTVGARG